MWSPKRLTHLSSVRFAVNAGIHFPLCRVPVREGTLLDLDATGYKQSGKLDDVTCPRCRDRYARWYMRG